MTTCGDDGGGGGVNGPLICVNTWSPVDLTFLFRSGSTDALGDVVDGLSRSFRCIGSHRGHGTRQQVACLRLNLATKLTTGR